MSRPLDVLSRTDAITNGITRIIARGGVEQLTTRAIAEQAGISIGTLANHLSNRERVLRVCGHRFSTRRLQDLRDRVGGQGLDAFLPCGPAELVMTRVWLAWRELARNDESLAHTVATADFEERHLILTALVPGVPRDWRLHHAASLKTGGPKNVADDVVLDLVVATVHGLREATCRSAEPMPLVEAQRTLAAAASAFSRSSATIVSGSSAE